MFRILLSVNQRTLGTSVWRFRSLLNIARVICKAILLSRRLMGENVSRQRLCSGDCARAVTTSAEIAVSLTPRFRDLHFT